MPRRTRSRPRIPRATAREVRLHLAHVEEAVAWAPTIAKPIGIVSGNSTSRGNVTHTPSHDREHQPARRDHHQVDPEHACRHGREGDPALRSGERCRDGDPHDRDREVGEREGAGAVLVEEECAHRNDEEGHQQAQPHRLPPEQEEPRPHQAGGRECDLAQSADRAP